MPLNITIQGIVQDVGFRPFSGRIIVISSLLPAGASMFILPDLAACPGCIDGVFDPANCFYRYPFTSCYVLLLGKGFL